RTGEIMSIESALLKRIGRLVVAVSMLAGPAVAAAESEFSSVYKLPPAIESVESLCPWKSPRAEGYIRVIRMRQADHDSLYLQWIQKNGNGLPEQVLSTRLVEELENGLAVHVENLSALLHPDQCELTAAAKATA